MTLAPLVAPSIRGVEGKPLLLRPGEKCVVPGCLSLAQQRHHMWPKSYLRGQPTEWVHVEGEVIPNTVGVCLRHHEWLTGLPGGHRGHIRWSATLHLLEWWELDDIGTWVHRGPLRFTPLVNPEPEAAKARKSEGLCPTCGRPHPVPREKRLPKRKAKEWTLSVPDDAETGTDVLDTYVENLAVLMGLDPSSPRLLRYHVLVPVLEWVSQSEAEFLRDWLD